MLLSQRKQYIKELERLLLKYNQFIKNTYKHYMEESNRIRQRTLMVLPGKEHYSNDNKYKIAVAAVKARKIQKRIFCMTMDTMIQCLRDLGVIDLYFSADDAANVVKRMKKNRLHIIHQLYRSLMETTGTNGSLPVPPAPDTLDGNNNASQPHATMDKRTWKRLLQTAQLSYGDLLDAYLEPYGHDDDYIVQGSCPILEYEFVEIIVRAVAESSARRGHVNVDLFQILSKIFHQRMLPLLSEGVGILSPHLQHLYVDQVQDLFKNRSIVTAPPAAVAPPPSVSPTKTMKRLATTHTMHGNTANNHTTLHEEFKSADARTSNKIEDMWLMLKKTSHGKDCRSSHLTQGIVCVVCILFLNCMKL